MNEQEQVNYHDSLRQFNSAAERLQECSSNELEKNFRFYINFYIQHQRLSQQFFNCFCQHNALERLFSTPSKHLPSLTVLELFHLLISNQKELVFVFSKQLVHDYLFVKFSPYKECPQAVQYYVQLLKTIIMKLASKENSYLIKLFCNKVFPSFPLLTVVTILGVKDDCDQLVRITAQQCVLLLINLINESRTGLVYLNELQMVVFYFELSRQMLEEKNTDREGSIKYFIDLLHTLRHNQTSLYLLLNTLTNLLFFLNSTHPQKILRFLRELREHISQYPQFSSKLADNCLLTLYRILCKFFFSNSVNYTYFCAQQIIPSLTIKPQPKLLKFFLERSRKIEDHLVDQEEYFRSEKANAALFEEWLHFNDNAGMEPLRLGKGKSGVSEFFSGDAVERYVEEAMTMAGLEAGKLRSPIKLTVSSNFKTSLYLVENIIGQAIKEGVRERVEEGFCRGEEWAMRGSEGLFVEVYRVYLRNPNYRSKSELTIILDVDDDLAFQGETEFLYQIKPTIARCVAEELCGKEPNLSKHYLLLLFKLFSKLQLTVNLEPTFIEQLLIKLFELQKVIAEFIFYDESMPSVLNYLIKNQERPYVKEKIDITSIKKGTFNTNRPKEIKLEHFLFHYEVIKRYLDPSLKVLNDFIEEYWKPVFCVEKNGKQEYKMLMVCKDVLNNYIEVSGTNKFQFEVCYRKSKNEELFRFILSDKDFAFEKATSNILRFLKYQGQGEIRLASTNAAEAFRRDIWEIRQSRKEIIRQAVLEYMPFIYESIEVKYRNNKYEASPSIATTKRG